MIPDKIALVVLAAGKGTRLKLDIPKPLAPFAGRTLIDCVLDEVSSFGDLKIITGYKKELIESHLESQENFRGEFIFQEEQLGTGHAIQTYFDQSGTFADQYKYTIVLCADTPLITAEVIRKLINEVKKDYKAVCATFELDDPTGYGRIERADKGFSIIEQKDATVDQLAIKEVNSGLYIFETEYLQKHVKSLDNNNNSGEFYLTDTCKKNFNVHPLKFEDPTIFYGINDLIQLQHAEVLYGHNIKNFLMLNGVRFIDATSSYIFTKNIGEGTLIYPNVFIDHKSSIEANSTIEMGCFIRNSRLGHEVQIKANSYITDSIIGNCSKVGPMAQLRPGSSIGNHCKLGNFVEIKKSKIHDNSAVSHLSYVGDAEVGRDVNIGCGFITCNYDGANKHKSIIEDGAFIGSDTQLVAPIRIGKEAYIASGSTINKDVPDGAFAIARQKQVTKEAMAKRFIKKKSK